jgi:type II secretory pathway predicted ATPase ExeA
MEVVADGGGQLSVVLAGHPKLRNDLRQPTMEEIGYRTSAIAFDGIAGQQRDYIACHRRRGQPATPWSA